MIRSECVSTAGSASLQLPKAPAAASHLGVWKKNTRQTASFATTTAVIAKMEVAVHIYLAPCAMMKGPSKLLPPGAIWSSTLKGGGK